VKSNDDRDRTAPPLPASLRVLRLEEDVVRRRREIGLWALAGRAPLIGAPGGPALEVSADYVAHALPPQRRGERPVEADQRVRDLRRLPSQSEHVASAVGAVRAPVPCPVTSCTEAMRRWIGCPPGFRPVMHHTLAHVHLFMRGGGPAALRRAA